MAVLGGGARVEEVQPKDVEAARAAAGGKIHLVDVREADEFRAVRAEYATLLPLSEIAEGALPTLPKNETIYVICKSGGRSLRAAQVFMAAGFVRAVNVTGGTMAWEREGLPVARG